MAPRSYLGNVSAPLAQPPRAASGQSRPPPRLQGNDTGVFQRRARRHPRLGTAPVLPPPGTPSSDLISFLLNLFSGRMPFTAMEPSVV